MVQDAKGRTRIQGAGGSQPQPRQLSVFMPAGFSSIVPKEKLSPVPEECPGAKALSRQELEDGMDLIQGLLDEQTAESEKREQAEAMAKAARVPWLAPEVPRNDFPRKPRAKHMNRKSLVSKWCFCDGDSCNGSDGDVDF